MTTRLTRSAFTASAGMMGCVTRGLLWFEDAGWRCARVAGARGRLQVPLAYRAPSGLRALPLPAEQRQLLTAPLGKWVEAEERLARRILEKRGYRVLLARSPDEALGIASDEPDIAVLLSDVVLPGMSGPALATELLRTHPDVRVLYMSGYSDDALSQRGVRDPGTELIEKPFSANALVAKVDEVAHRAVGDRLDW